jgi:hypothetical protein
MWMKSVIFLFSFTRVFLVLFCRGGWKITDFIDFTLPHQPGCCGEAVTQGQFMPGVDRPSCAIDLP